ncbi:DUF418 domain-containing protein [Parabacteroides sp. OttesenSCG-928-N08]|nr:DUF418 domain-containing protein [Parabacteroides sp. OttesenSCG-928-N08]
MTQVIAPKKRINSIDALRGFALFGILMFHCMEHFDLMYEPQLTSPFWQTIDTAVFKTISFLFAGKSYAIFSLLFGLSFFMQMDSQADKGVDFRGRFVWRLALLFLLGYLNGLVYMGEFFVVYAILGLFLIPLYKVPTKWLLGIALFLFLQPWDAAAFLSLLHGSAPNEPTFAVAYMDSLYEECAQLFIHGSFADVIQFNAWKGQFAKLLWVFNSARYPQLIGLFVVGMLIGRAGIHKSEEKMIAGSKRILPYSVAIFLFFYALVLLLPVMGVSGYALRSGTTLLKTYANLGMMMMYVSGFILLYYKSGLRSGMDRMAPVGRMSVTNYMMQGLIGVPLFYGFGLNLAIEISFLQSMLIGLVIYAFQLLLSNWWMKQHYYGPMEWLWRTATWFKPVPLKRNRP